MIDLLFFLTLSAALGCGLIAGVFFAFSSFVMGALAKLAPDRGMEAMQSINRVVLNVWFLGAFMGAAVLCLAVGILAILDGGEGATFRIVGALLYIVGTFAVTAGGNVPLNDRLEKVDAKSSEAPALWDHYLKRWTLWNHVRTVAALMAAGFLTLALTA